MCNVERTSSYDKAKEMLETQYFDMAVLDIMAVNGYELLDLVNEKNVMAVILTAHSSRVEDTDIICGEGAASCMQKSKAHDMRPYTDTVLDAHEVDKQPWWGWFNRLGTYYEKIFGSEWVSYEEFWETVLREKYDTNEPQNHHLEETRL
jgi:hypothetical protein